MLKKLMAALAVAACFWLAWQAWLPPSTKTASGIRMNIPAAKPTSHEQWRIVTRRMVWGKSVQAMQTQLAQEELPFELLRRREPIELHVFDDERSFDSAAEAGKVKEAWRKQGIEAEVVKYGDHLIVALGRFYLTAYAEQLQEKLRQVGQPYRYEQRNVDIPVYRFISSPLEKQQAEEIWQRLQSLGIADPVLMRESRYESLFGDMQSTGQESE